MARSWSDVASGRARGMRSDAPEFVPAYRSATPRAPSLACLVAVPCDDCGADAHLCANGCVLPASRRGRKGVWICAPCDYEEDVRISQMPYMDIGQLADPDTERKEPFQCDDCYDKKAEAAWAAVEAATEKQRLRALAEAPAYEKAEAARDAFRQAHYEASRAELRRADTLSYKERAKVLARLQGFRAQNEARNRMNEESSDLFDKVFREELERLGLSCEGDV